MEISDQNIECVRLGERSVYLIGTAHVSKSSAELVERVIREVRPDSVAVELCEPRFQSLQNPDRWRNTDIVSIIRKGKAYVLLAQLMLAGFQRKLGKKIGVNPGAEMMAGIAAAQEVGAETVLADRNITTTLKRTWGALGVWSMLKVIGAAIGGSFGREEISEEEIERLKKSDALDELMREFSEELPEVRKTLIDERDTYLAKKITDARGKTVVAVLGAGHLEGVKRQLGNDIDLAPLETIPPPNLLLRIIGWVIPLAFFALVIAGFFWSGGETSMKMVWSWILVTGSFAALGSVIALAHPVTILSAFLAAPLTTLHPLLASGWVAALVEALIRKPRVADLESVADDFGRWNGPWTNRLGRILLVMVFTNLFGSIGAIWGVKVVLSLL